MLKEAIRHESDSEYAYAVDADTLVIKLETKKDDVEKVVLCYGDRYEPSESVTFYEIEMEKTYADGLHDYYEAVIRPPFNRICYYFKLIDGDEVKIYSQGRFYDKLPVERNKYYIFPYICRGDLYKKFDWWENLVVYLIFVDRFNKENIDESWYRKPTSNDFFGGNLQGIIDKLDYLSDLGINCILLTPIFESESNHKYDTIDYYHIDRAFGNEEIFKKLVEECHKRGMKIILDAVFNHTSTNFFAFVDARKKGSASKYRNWYFFDDKGRYETFAYTEHMPKLNTANSDVAEYLLGVAKYWIENFDIDGWRLDVANEIDHKFWRKFRDTVKQAKEDAIIIGEAWDGAESFLKGDQFDSVMNYPFMYILIDYFARNSIDTFEFDRLINNLYVRYKKYTRTILLNLLDSHDTSRFLYECDGDVEKLKLAVFFEMTCIGIPMVFYGDEAGICGGRDPDTRRGMDFSCKDEELYLFYKKMIELRKENGVLKSGEYRTVLTGKDVYAYSRYTDREKIINVFNKGSSNVEITLKTGGNMVLDLFNRCEYKVVDGFIRLNTRPMGKYVLKIL